MVVADVPAASCAGHRVGCRADGHHGRDGGRETPAAEVLAKLDADVQLGPSSVLVAHHAPAEAGILYAYRRHCPRLAATHLLDTVRLGRAAYPDLHSHSLDMLIHHLRLRRPANRHRAMADVEVTAKVFAALLAHGARTGLWTRLRDLRDVAGYEAKATRPEQGTLFDEYDTSSST
ncbi:MAG: 3'-5' exonuclease [Actinopolymorphaceae bacterium]